MGKSIVLLKLVGVEFEEKLLTDTLEVEKQGGLIDARW